MTLSVRWTVALALLVGGIVLVRRDATALRTRGLRLSVPSAWTVPPESKPEPHSSENRPFEEADPVLGATLFGVVHDAAGNPLPGATIMAVDPETESDVVDSEEKSHDRICSTSGEDGRYRLPVWEGGKYLIATHDRYPMLWTEVFPENGERDLHFSEPAAVDGVVVDEGGVPLEGVRVTAVISLLFLEQEAPTFATTDALGCFRIPKLPAGVAVILGASASGYCPVGTGVAPLSPGESRRVALTLKAGIVLHGVVVDWEGRPLPGADVRATIPDSGSWREFTDDAGRFEIRTPRPVEMELRVGKAGYVRNERCVNPGEGQIRVRLARMRQVAGRLSGPLLEEREIFVCYDLDPQCRVRQRVAEDGSFELVALPPWREVPLDVEEEGRRITSYSLSGEDRGATGDLVIPVE